MRIQFELSDRQSEAFNDLKNTIDVSTNKDLLNNSLTLLNWAVSQIKQGKTVGSYDSTKDLFTHLEMPIFNHISIYGGESQKNTKVKKEKAKETELI